jgi:hypothetical protein
VDEDLLAEKSGKGSFQGKKREILEAVVVPSEHNPGKCMALRSWPPILRFALDLRNYAIGWVSIIKD